MAEPNSPLITPSEFAAALDGPSPPLLLDLRPAEAFAQGHLQGAVSLDLWGLSLIDTSDAPLRAFLWIIEHLFALRGVTADRPVVVYEEDSGFRAARAYWFLDYFGHPSVQLLDGGLRAWSAAGLPVTTRVTMPVASEWHGTPHAGRIATWQDLRDRLGRPDAVILDTRSDAEYFGEAVRARRGGAVPDAIHLEWTHNLHADGTFKTRNELAAIYAAAGVSPERDVIAYCQGGYRAAHTYLALKLLGFPRVRNYLGSWREWGDRDDLPIEHPRRMA